MPVRSGWFIVLSKSSISFLIYSLVVQSILESEVS